MSSKWAKIEEEILKESFVELAWEELLKKLPGKTEKQILLRAKKLGLKREDELIATYYDDVKGGWVEEKRTFGDTIMKVSMIFPCEKDVTFEAVKNTFAKHASKVFYETIIEKQYYNFLLEFRFAHHVDIFNAFVNFKIKTLFGNISDNEFEKAKNEFIDSIHKVLIEKEDENQVPIDDRSNKLKK